MIYYYNVKVNQLNSVINEDIENVISRDLPWEKLEGKNILVTGANGFLPAYIVYTLLLINDRLNLCLKVFALARNKEKTYNRFKEFIDRRDLEIIVQDVCSPINIEERVDFIIHAASQASPKYFGSDPVGTLNANVIGTNNLLQFAKDKKVEGFLYFSSSEVYGAVSSEKTLTSESDYGFLDPTNIRSCYAEAKRMGETMCVSWLHQFGVPVFIVRPFHTYGPGMDLSDGRVYADFVKDIINNNDIVINSDGSAVRAFCYISDATAAFLQVLLKGEKGNAYNVGNNRCEHSILELAENLVTLFPEKKLKVIRQNVNKNGYIQSLVSHISPDTKKIEALGWRPTLNISEGFLRTISSYL